MTKCLNIYTKRLSTFQITVCASVYYAAELHLSSRPNALCLYQLMEQHADGSLMVLLLSVEPVLGV